MKPDEKINAFLKNFELSDIEVALYTGLLETGPTTVLELSKHVGIKRTTSHVNIENLIQKGFVAQTQKGARRKILAEAPEKLETILNNKKQKIRELEKTLPDIIDQINQTTIESTTKTSIRYYEGEEGFRKVSDRSIEKAAEWTHGKNTPVWIPPMSASPAPGPAAIPGNTPDGTHPTASSHTPIRAAPRYKK